MQFHNLAFPSSLTLKVGKGCGESLFLVPCLPDFLSFVSESSRAVWDRGVDIKGQMGLVHLVVLFEDLTVKGFLHDRLLMLALSLIRYHSCYSDHGYHTSVPFLAWFFASGVVPLAKLFYSVFFASGVVFQFCLYWGHTDVVSDSLCKAKSFQTHSAHGSSTAFGF